MPDRAILDSSIIVAMFFKEAASSRTLKCATECDPVTLDLAIAEVGNVASKQIVLPGESKERILDALQDCQDFITVTCTIMKAFDSQWIYWIESVYRNY